MAMLKFNYGLASQIENAAYVEGNLYIATDSKSLYVDLDGGRVHVSDFIQVNTQADLTALGTYYTHVFYYVTESNALLKYTGTGWNQLNSTADLTKALEDLTARVETNEKDIVALKSADSALDERIDGINASNVNTTADITVTTAVGNYKKGDVITADDLQTILLNMLCQEVNPTATAPSISSVSLSPSEAKEVGTTVTPTYTVNTSLGSYSANGVTQNSGVSINSYSVTEVGRPDGATAGTGSTKNGSFSSFVVTDATSYYVNATVAHSAGDVPKTYLGKDYPEVQIQANTLTKASSKITGYRPIFYGMRADTTALDSASVRGLTNTNNAPSGRTLTFTAANLSGVKRFIIAIPASSGLKVTKATITSSMNADATNDYSMIGTVEVAGANNYATTATYNIWVYQPASIASTEVHSVTIG